ncbi:MAG: hypothetical protein JWR48_3778 [Mycobacterium sp.]|jgi:hypothetical protein|nr:hypothetical protein [Mycobacterium sp.]
MTFDGGMERSAVTAFAAPAVRPHNALGRGQLPGGAPSTVPRVPRDTST